MPEDWAKINAMAGQMDAVMVGSPGELDNNPLAQATAGESIANGLRPDDKFWHDLKLQPPVIRTDTRWCPDYDESVSTTPLLRAFVYDRQADAHAWVPLAARQRVGPRSRTRTGTRTRSVRPTTTPTANTSSIVRTPIRH